MPIKALSVLALIFTCNALSAKSTGGSEHAEDEFFESNEMPRFYDAECEAMENRKERQKCADMAMLELVYKNISYPAEAKKDGIEGSNSQFENYSNLT
jgi:hypothetical protein